MGGWSRSAACNTLLGKQILAYMGIRAVRPIHDDGSIFALLLECWQRKEGADFVSKGFACVSPLGVEARGSLDDLGDGNGLTSGKPAFAPVADGMYMYLLHELDGEDPPPENS
jgi:hypothetical protein